MSAEPVKRLRVLIAEDETLIVCLLEDMLTQLGHTVVGEARKLHTALALAKTGDYDLAILDVNLNGRSSHPVAQIARERGKRVLLATGYGRPEDGAVVLQKPFGIEALSRCIHAVIEGGSSP